MSHEASPVISDLHYIVILFLMAYLLSSAPSFVKEWRKNDEAPQTGSVSGISQIIKAGKIYGVDPYIKVWKVIQPTFDPASWQSVILNTSGVDNRLPLQDKPNQMLMNHHILHSR